jgi:hypothetical protein
MKISPSVTSNKVITSILAEEAEEDDRVGIEVAFGGTVILIIALPAGV